MEGLNICAYFTTLMMVIARINAADTTVTDLVSFDVSIGKIEVGTIQFGLFGETAPKTVKNFVALASGEKGYGYQGTKFHRVIDEFMIQGGDYVHHNGSGEGSIYGGRFPDEKFTLNHYGAGWLSMANAGPNSNTCQFFIPATATYWLDGKHVVFGKVLSGMKVMRKILDVSTDDKDAPKIDVVITKSSASKPDKPFVVEKEGADWQK